MSTGVQGFWVWAKQLRVYGSTSRTDVHLLCLAGPVFRVYGSGRVGFWFQVLAFWFGVGGFGLLVLSFSFWSLGCGCWRSGFAPHTTLETTQGQIDGFFGQPLFKCYLPEVVSVGDWLNICHWVASRVGKLRDEL